MTLITCLDERDGMSFHNRRQSRDLRVYERILNMFPKSRIWLTQNAAKLFPDGEIHICRDPLAQTPDDGCCFVEDGDVLKHMDRVDTVVIYRWNRHYPSDVSFPMHCLAAWTLVRTEQFPGNSHECITEEVYHR